MLIYAFKCFHNLLPVDVTPLVERNIVTHSHHVRNIDNYALRVPVNRTVRRDKFISFVASKFWNGLSKELRESRSLAIFKSELKSLYLG